MMEMMHPSVRPSIPRQRSGTAAAAWESADTNRRMHSGKDGVAQARRELNMPFSRLIRQATWTFSVSSSRRLRLSVHFMVLFSWYVTMKTAPWSVNSEMCNIKCILCALDCAQFSVHFMVQFSQYVTVKTAPWSVNSEMHLNLHQCKIKCIWCALDCAQFRVYTWWCKFPYVHIMVHSPECTKINISECELHFCAHYMVCTSWCILHNALHCGYFTVSDTVVNSIVHISVCTQNVARFEIYSILF